MFINKIINKIMDTYDMASSREVRYTYKYTLTEEEYNACQVVLKVFNEITSDHTFTNDEFQFLKFLMQLMDQCCPELEKIKNDRINDDKAIN